MTEQRLLPDSLCPVCSQRGASRVFVKNGYDIARCIACSAFYVSPMPSDEFLRAHYQDPAYFEGDEAQGYCNYADMRKALAPHYARRLRMLRGHIPSQGLLLDFGCAAGYFLELARAQGWQISGVEVARAAADAASQRLGITIANSLSGMAAHSFDAVTLWEVIEHLPRPVEQLRELRGRLRPGGLLMLSTPNTGHWQAIREPNEWEGYRPPSHLVFFTQATLTSTLQQAGFEHIEIYRVSPLPPLPTWLRKASSPLRRGLATGQTKSWSTALYIWRAIRAAGWAWQKLVRPRDDIFTTLEALAFCPG